jgi:hypothetical protein
MDQRQHSQPAPVTGAASAAAAGGARLQQQSSSSSREYEEAEQRQEAWDDSDDEAAAPAAAAAAAAASTPRNRASKRRRTMTPLSGHSANSVLTVLPLTASASALANASSSSSPRDRSADRSRSPSAGMWDIDVPDELRQQSPSSASTSSSKNGTKQSGGRGSAAQRPPKKVKCRSLLLVVKTHDPFVDTIGYDDAESFKRGIAEMLTDNPRLKSWACALDALSPPSDLEPWIKRVGAEVSERKRSKDCVSGLPLPEFKLLTLQLLRRLKNLVDASEGTWKLYVSILRYDTLVTELGKAMPSKAQECRDQSIAAAAKGAIHWKAFQSAEWEQLTLRELKPVPEFTRNREDENARLAALPQVSGESLDDCRFFYRFVPSLDEARKETIHAVYLPSLMWFSDLGHQADLKAGLLRFLESGCSGGGKPASKHRAAATLYPPLLWEALCEQKQDVYARFKQVMISCTWHQFVGGTDPTRAVADAEAFAAKLLDAVGNPTKGSFMLKGSWADGKSCVKKIDVAVHKSGVRQFLASKVAELVFSFNQRWFTLQPFSKALMEHECRIWCVASSLFQPRPLAKDAAAADTVAHSAAASASAAAAPSASAAAAPSASAAAASPAKCWRIAVALVSLYQSERVAALASGPYEYAEQQCFGFVEWLLKAHAPFFDNLLQLGMPALRVDCFYSPEENTVLLNELTVPNDAMMFTHCHNQSLPRLIAESFGDGLFEQLQPRHRHGVK